MDFPPKVQLLLKDRLIKEVLFEDAVLRIGRMKENDLVVNNLAVSRFHAVLHREDDGAFRIEDLGSENGTLVNGVAVDGSADVRSGDEITIGKHTLRIDEVALGDTALPAAPPGSSDAWDAAQTYFAELPPRLVDDGAASGEAVSLDAVLEAEPLVEAEAVAEPESSVAEGVVSASVCGPEDSPDPSGAFSIGEEEILAEATSGDGASLAAPNAEVEPDIALAASSPHPNGEHTALFDFGPADAPRDAEDDDESIDTAPRATRIEEEAHTTEWSPEVEAMEAARPAPELHAGWIIQRDGRVDGVVAWEAASLVVGRGSSCDIVLGEAGVSRDHATFVRTDQGYEVHDTGSVNGTWVNGELVDGRWALRVGDVVKIDDFELTFVLDHNPVGSEVQSHEAAPPAAPPGNQTIFEDAPAMAAPVVDVLHEEDEDEGEKELEITNESAVARHGAAGLVPLEELVRVEIEIPRDALPPSLRLAMEEAGEDSLRLPAEIRIRLR